MRIVPLAAVAPALLLLLCSPLPTLAAAPSGSESGECSHSSSSSETCTSSSPFHRMSNLTIGILGTGRLGAHTAATWAAAGHRVLLGSRDPNKAREIVQAIRSPAGYRGKGGEQTKALPDGARIDLEGTDMAGGRRQAFLHVPECSAHAFARRCCCCPNHFRGHTVPCY